MVIDIHKISIGRDYCGENIEFSCDNNFSEQVAITALLALESITFRGKKFVNVTNPHEKSKEGGPHRSLFTLKEPQTLGIAP